TGQKLSGHPLGFGAELRRRREAAGLSLAALARLVHYSKSHLGKVETGVKRPGADLARRCDSALACGGSLAALCLASAPVTPHPQWNGPGEVWVMSLANDGHGEFRAIDHLDVPLPGGFSLLRNNALRGNENGAVGPTAVASFRSMFGEIRQLGQAAAP